MDGRVNQWRRGHCCRCKCNAELFHNFREPERLIAQLMTADLTHFVVVTGVQGGKHFNRLLCLVLVDGGVAPDPKTVYQIVDVC